MTELVNLSPGFHGFEICCHKQLKFRDKIFSVMGSMSGAGLSLSCICGYCGSSHQIKIDYPDWKQYVKGEEACVEKQVLTVSRATARAVSAWGNLEITILDNIAIL